MARRRSRTKNTGKAQPAARRAAAAAHSKQGVFARIACAISWYAGRPAAFLIAAAAVIIWAASGPLFGFSDTWQLVINTSTTIVTFLMVFLIQNTQNRDTTALQVKLDELIFQMDGANNKIAAAEQLSDEELEQLHNEYERRAESALESLQQRRAGKADAA